MIELLEVKSKKELKSFVTFPFNLYAGSKYWVPPIITDEMATFTKDKNPALEHADVHLYLAKKNGAIAGRVAAIINWTEVKEQQVKKMRFGWFDVIDDFEVSKMLLDKVTEIGKSHNLKFIEGPVGFSNLDKNGALTEGFDHIGTMATWYNHAYYIDHFKKYGLSIEKEYIESKFDFKKAPVDRFKRVNTLIKERYNLKPANFTNSKDIIPYLDDMFALFNRSYSKLSTFVPISGKQQEYLKKKFISFINPEYIKFVLDSNDNMVAFAIVLPSFSKALQEVKGKLFPFGFLKLLKAKKNSKTALFYLIGVDPHYQNKGVTAIIFEEFHKSLSKNGIDTCIRLPELADNHASHQIWKDFNAQVIKRRATFKKLL
ncbi:GTP cyclohydrolase [Hanstruepera neustonica]|uniref:GTP cyclohydrolase n=1 Tax=Hanstruepera neustonica TaxID=1445657 RepID=A0A2K1DXZ3_9FLAO|nr:GTP cyclohydrolase [Hanstruepera neustonica]PNQ72891.1 GTP cyclohydrolase [Hanstruepera neustonica]